MSLTAIVHRHRSRGMPWVGGSAVSASSRYHSAQAVTPRQRGRWRRSFPRCQRPLDGGEASQSGSEPWGVCRHHEPATDTRDTSEGTGELREGGLFERGDQLGDLHVVAIRDHVNWLALL